MRVNRREWEKCHLIKSLTCIFYPNSRQIEKGLLLPERQTIVGKANKTRCRVNPEIKRLHSVDTGIGMRDTESLRNWIFLNPPETAKSKTTSILSESILNLSSDHGRSCKGNVYTVILYWLDSHF